MHPLWPSRHHSDHEWNADHGPAPMFMGDYDPLLLHTPRPLLLIAFLLTANIGHIDLLALPDPLLRSFIRITVAPLLPDTPNSCQQLVLGCASP